jgi:hypothetical protein
MTAVRKLKPLLSGTSPLLPLLLIVATLVIVGCSGRNSGQPTETGQQVPGGAQDATRLPTPAVPEASGSGTEPIDVPMSQGVVIG